MHPTVKPNAESTASGPMLFTEGQGRGIPFRQHAVNPSLGARWPPPVDSMEHSLPYLISIGVGAGFMDE